MRLTDEGWWAFGLTYIGIQVFYLIVWFFRSIVNSLLFRVYFKRHMVKEIFEKLIEWRYPIGEYESGGRGWDVSYLPQRSTCRPYWLRQFEIIDRKAEREAWRLHKEGKPPAPDAIGRIVEEGDWLSFRLFDWVNKEREQEYRERPEKLFIQAFDS